MFFRSLLRRRQLRVMTDLRVSRFPHRLRAPASFQGSTLNPSRGWRLSAAGGVEMGHPSRQPSRSGLSLLTIGSQWFVPLHHRIAVVRREAWLKLAE